jgi:NAD(P)-dependent dehydrogenase (short-subunit alcohol dehydrogenase family)
MKTVLITGANRGIGLKFVEYYCQHNWQVYATYRDEHHTLLDRTTQYENLTLLKVDVSDPASVAKLKHSMTGITLDLLINNAGTYGPRGHGFGQTTTEQVDEWQNVFAINTIAPMLITEALCKNLQFGAPAKVAFVSSKMASINDNSSGGSYIYRSSKTALNAVVKSLSIDLEKYDISVVSLHPGWVKTRMGGDSALINTNTSVTGMTNVIENLTPEQSGQFINFDGTKLTW